MSILTWKHTTMSSVTDYVGEGWDERKITIFFNEKNNIVNRQEEVANYIKSI
jgi:hypothetical protein